MAPISLYEFCLDRIIELIKADHWSEETENPFSRLPSRIVELLVEVCGTSQKFSEFSYFRMLLSSGKLRKLKLCFPVIFTDKCMVLPQMLTEKGCLNINVLELDRNFNNDESEWLESLLEKLPLLESLSVRTIFNPQALKNCRGLKSVKIIQTLWDTKKSDNFLSEAADTLSHLKDLEEFDVFQRRTKFFDFLQVIKLLNNHPKLASLRFTDSSRAAHIIYVNNTVKTLPKYGLRKCSWTSSTGSFEGITLLYNSFLRRIRNSVFLFPLVEELEISVLREDCFEYLKDLEHLRCLKIEFDIHTAYQQNLSFLSDIGQQLSHLSIVSHRRVPVNAISKYCSNLEYLKIKGNATLFDSIESSNNFGKLKRLEIGLIDEQSLLYVFQNVENLKELQFSKAAFLDDQRLLEILSRNPLAFYHLDKVFVRDCMLSKEGFRIFLERAVNLTMACIKSSHYSEDEQEDFSDVIQELQRDVVHNYNSVEHFFKNTSFFSTSNALFSLRNIFSIVGKNVR
ncbi:uncharacterized protein CDAR_180071 [Caerostris darwini]|uniref:Uncharacterized protein n=1 Tax=Caerostris darwini TaxID=1538125 RepID=A0AAV4TZ16_9ARAC|nr:uncharacterized protein CDAR_180071 [Caerostris darwini]